MRMLTFAEAECGMVVAHVENECWYSVHMLKTLGQNVGAGCPKLMPKAKSEFSSFCWMLRLCAQRRCRLSTVQESHEMNLSSVQKGHHRVKHCPNKSVVSPAFPVTKCRLLECWCHMLYNTEGPCWCCMPPLAVPFWQKCDSSPARSWQGPWLKQIQRNQANLILFQHKGLL